MFVNRGEIVERGVVGPEVVLGHCCLQEGGYSVDNWRISMGS